MPYSNHSSGRYCSIIGCRNSNKLLYHWKEATCFEVEHLGLLHKDCPCAIPFNFRLFPKDPDLRQEWCRKINRKNFTPRKDSVVCSNHFIDGRPTPENPCPVLNLGYEPLQSFRPRRRQIKKTPLPAKRRRISGKADLVPETSPTQQEEFLGREDPTLPTLDTPEHNNCPPIEQHVPDIDMPRQPLQVEMTDKQTQWQLIDIYPDHTYAVNHSVISHSRPKTNSCGTQTHLPSITNCLLGDKDYKFYTSLPMAVFLCLVATLGKVIKTPFSKLSVHDQLLLVFCRLRLGLLFGDLGRRFNVSKSHSSRIFKFWLPRMANEMRQLIVWLPRDTIRRTMPDCFQEKYPFTTCVIDCAEIILERARSHWMRAVTYSNYKGRNTIKFLLAIAPNGLIMFVSDCFGGRASDQFITQHSGLLNYLLPGDEIMADRGFLIEDILPPGTKINVPPFTKGKLQLPETEVTRGRRIASVRVHVERVIAQLKKYRVFKSSFPLIQNTLADSVLIVCAALCNLQKSVVNKTCSKTVKSNKKNFRK